MNRASRCLPACRGALPSRPHAAPLCISRRICTGQASLLALLTSSEMQAVALSVGACTAESCRGRWAPQQEAHTHPSWPVGRWGPRLLGPRACSDRSLYPPSESLFYWEKRECD